MAEDNKDKLNLNNKTPDPAKTPVSPASKPEPLPPPPSKWVLTLQKILLILKNIITKILSIKWPRVSQKAILKVAFVFIFGFSVFWVFKTAPQWNLFGTLPYPASFETLADSKLILPKEENVYRYDNDLLSPQYIALISKIVVNIKAGNSSLKNPMIAFDLYVRTTTEASAAEIRNREKQLQDHLQRFSENLTYDEILTEEGKRSWKKNMKRELNLVLNTGKVKEIYFKTLLIKP